MSSELSPARPDRDYSKPVLEQAKRPQLKHKPNLWNRFRNLALAGAITAGAVGSAAVALDEYDKHSQNEITLSEMFKNGEIAGIDTSTYQITTYVDGSLLHIRKEADKLAENIDLAKIRKINGVDWDGNSSFIIKNSPYKMGLDPMNNIDQDAWIALRLEIETALGTRVEATGFLNNGRATERHIVTIDKGKIAQPMMDKNGQLAAELNSGRVIPAERIALGIPHNPQS